MRADRLLALLLLLQARGRLTARELAERLEVSERTIYRDVSALGAAGVPVYAERGPGGGCALLDGYRTSLTGLSEAEVHTLIMSGVPGPLAELGFGPALEAALLKLLAALPAARRRDAERARQRVYLDASGWSSDERAPHLATIQEAVWDERRLRLAYRKGSGELVERLIDPLGLVAKAGVWYLVGAADSEVRVFRVSRVRAAALTDEPCRRPDDFDLAAYWAESSARFRASWGRYPVTLRGSPAFVRLLPVLFGEGVQSLIERAGPPDAAGWTTLTLSFESYDAARGRVLSFGTLAEVLDPPELRAGLMALAAQVVSLYQSKGGS
jgi:predicted DNA-binding transcriptional regulator YafY